ncbi:MAG: hypothetical protein WBP94_00185 [Rhodomicrobiaceae bacterium]
MSQSQLLSLAQKSIRLSIISETHETKLALAIEKWFVSEFVKAMKLPLLKKIYESGSFGVFVELLAAQSDPDRITVLEKVDKNNPQLHKLSKKQAFVHLEQLARGAIKPVPKPKRGANGSGRSGRSKSGADLIADSRY